MRNNIMVNLDDFNNLGALMTDVTSVSKDPFMLDISLIDEDPNQPRTDKNPGFSEDSIHELAQTIKERGVKSPISVRESGNGRFIINHGARRYRASKIAGLTKIPGIIDNDYVKLDQVIENIQRNSLTPNEIATFIDEELKRGKKKHEVAAELGKSNAWVSQYYALITLPEEIEFCWQGGVFGDDVTVASEIAKSYKKNPDVVMDFLKREKKVGRKDAARLKEIIDNNEFSDLDKFPSDIEEIICDTNETVIDENDERYFVKDGQITKRENIDENTICKEDIEAEYNVESDIELDKEKIIAEKIKSLFSVIMEFDIERQKKCAYLSEKEIKVAEMCRELIIELY